MSRNQTQSNFFTSSVAAPEITNGEPLVLRMATTIGTSLASSTDNLAFFADGYKASYHATKRDSATKRKAVQSYLIAKYKL